MVFVLFCFLFFLKKPLIVTEDLELTYPIFLFFVPLTMPCRLWLILNKMAYFKTFVKAKSFVVCAKFANLGSKFRYSQWKTYFPDSLTNS